MTRWIRFAVAVGSMVIGVARAAPVVAKLWTSPDNRWVAAFPTAPERIDLQASGASGVGFRSLVHTSDGPILYIVTLAVVDAIDDRPIDSQVREMLQMSTHSFVGSVGGRTSKLKTTWGTFGKGLPRLDHELRYDRDGAEFETVGFFTLVATEMVRVSATYPVAIAKEQRPRARRFVQSFMMLK